MPGQREPLRNSAKQTMNGSGGAERLGELAQDCMAMMTRADSGLPEMATVSALTEFKSLMAGRFRRLGNRGNALTNRQVFFSCRNPVPAPGLISVIHKRACHGSGMLPSAGRYVCKTGINLGIEGLLGKSWPEAATSNSTDSGGSA